MVALCTCCHILLMREVVCFHVPALGADTWRDHLISPGICPFHFIIINLYLFSVTNITMSVATFMSPMSHSNELLSLKVILGSSDNFLYKTYPYNIF